MLVSKIQNVEDFRTFPLDTCALINPDPTHKIWYDNPWKPLFPIASREKHLASFLLYLLQHFTNSQLPPGTSVLPVLVWVVPSSLWQCRHTWHSCINWNRSLFWLTALLFCCNWILLRAFSLCIHHAHLYQKLRSMAHIHGLFYCMCSH